MREYGFKPTVAGRELLAACMATGSGLEITRVGVGSGKVGEDVNLADVTDLLEYVAEGTIAERRHKDNILYLTVQYASNMTPGLGAFYLAEFAVWARHPVSGEEVMLLYATLGDYIQPVNAYSETAAPDVRQYPLALVLSDECVVTISAPGGLVTYDDLQDAVETACRELVDLMASGGIVKTILFTIPVDGWVEDAEPQNGYAYYYDLLDDTITANMIPDTTIAEESLDAAGAAGMCPTAMSYDGFVRYKCTERPGAALTLSCCLMIKGTYTPGGGSGGTYQLPAATAHALGGVKVQNGSGLTVDSEGNLAIDAATGADAEDLFGASDTDSAGE